LEVLANRGIHVSGAVDGRQVSFAPKPDGAWALVGIAANAEVGPHPIQLSIADEFGTTVSTTISLVVLDEDFGSEQIYIPADRVELLDPQLVAAEAERLSQIFARVSAQQLWKGTFRWPVVGRVTSPFGISRTYNDGSGSYHAGVDIAEEMATPVLAANAGQVVLAGPLKVHGNAVILDHGWGVYSAYYHLSDMFVQEGQAVDSGDTVGLLGNTGLSTGAHLHWEMRVGSVAVNPLEWTSRSIPAED
jgi:murein DD-endopeptidase MepM/ murein hydrolase activator NlpD